MAEISTDRNRATRLVLLTILIVAAVLRFPALTSVPPGLNQDEAANAWNAWCLLVTGTDQVGASWPVFYLRALGENRSTLFVYLLMPFQLLGGMNVFTTRLANACAGVLTVLLVYWLGRRLFGRSVGLIAAGTLAVLPWSLHFSRWGHEGGIAGLLALLAPAALVWSGWFGTPPGPAPRLWRNAVAGALCGGVCYGYPAIRLFVPTFLILLATLEVIRRRFASPAPTPPPHSGRAAMALLIGFFATFGPLAWQHVFNAREINRRADVLWLWSASDDAGAILSKVAARYAEHFAPDFLFRYGDQYEEIWCSGFGVLPGALAPLLLVGAIALLRDLFRGKSAAALLLAWLMAYPAGDILTHHMSIHAMRSLPGMAALPLLSALGAVELWRWLGDRRLPTIRFTTFTALGFVGIAESVRFMQHLYVDRPRAVAIRQFLLAELVEACERIRSRIDQYDAIYVTTTDMNEPYIVTLVALNYEPRRWHSQPQDVQRGGTWDRYRSYGNMHFLYDVSPREKLAELRAAGNPARVLFIAWDGDLDAIGQIERISSGGGRPDLLIHEVSLP